MNLKFTILGCGSSTGVPRVGGDWGKCDPNNPKNRRRRCSLLVEKTKGDEITTVLVDTGPDMREQLIDANVEWVDAVLYTHEHADHTHGIDDLRALVMTRRERVDVYMDQSTSDDVVPKFNYCFTSPKGSLYPPILNENRIELEQMISIEGPGGIIEAMPFKQHHGPIDSLGFRFGDIAYSSDLSDLPEESLPFVQDLDVWIVDCLKRKPHVTHFNLETTLEWIDRLKPKRAILTNMHVDLDYDELVSELPDGVEPAYDGMILQV